MSGYKFFPKKIQDDIPNLYSQEDEADPVVVTKFFTPDSNWTWYVIEGEERDDGDWLFFGYVEGFCGELGYFTLSQLESVKGPWGLKVERDIHWKKKKLSKIKERA